MEQYNDRLQIQDLMDSVAATSNVANDHHQNALRDDTVASVNMSNSDVGIEHAHFMSAHTRSGFERSQLIEQLMHRVSLWHGRCESTRIRLRNLEEQQVWGSVGS